MKQETNIQTICRCMVMPIRQNQNHLAAFYCSQILRPGNEQQANIDVIEFNQPVEVVID